MKFEFIFLSETPLLGISSESRYLKRILLVQKFFPKNTLKRMIFKNIILLLMILKLDRLLLFKSNEFYNKQINFLCDNKVKHVMIRFHTLSEKARCYCFFTDEKLILLSFAKMAFDVKNSQLLNKEKNIISRIEENDIFRVPRVLNVHNDKDIFGFTVEAIPANYNIFEKRDVFIDSCLLTVLQKNVRVCSCKYFQNLEWWLRFADNKKYNTIKNILINVGFFSLSRVHGDIGSENILVSTSSELDFLSYNNNMFIIDWERCDDNAPFLTDALGYWLGYNHKDILKKKSGLWLKTKFNNEFVHNYSNDKYNALAALAYLVSVDFDLAIILADSYCEGL